MLAYIARIACDCTGNTDCFANIASTKVAECRADPGVVSSCEGVILDGGSKNSVHPFYVFYTLVNPNYYWKRGSKQFCVIWFVLIRPSYNCQQCR